MTSPQGTLCLVLNGHLPFVRHPEIPECLEEDWFFEALTEVYLPLLEVFQRLKAEGIPFKVTLSLSPPLMAMLADPLILNRYAHHLENLIRLAESEVRRTADLPEFAPLAQRYLNRFHRCRRLWEDAFHRDLIGAFRELRESGQVELITTAATHGFLPLMEVAPQALKAQVELGCETFQRFFGNRPSGFWLPECGYTPLVGQVLGEAGIRYTFLETHGITHATPRPKFGVYAPVQTPLGVQSPSGLILLGRDPETAHQVWSAQDGYPADPWYREFYRDIGFDLDEGYLKPFLYHGGIRVSTGIKYFRITGRDATKEPYQPEKALERAKVHAADFLLNRERQVEGLFQAMGRPPLIVAMYDAELFGHWWFEGPDWLEALFRRVHENPSRIKWATPSEALGHYPRIQEVTAHLSTWGWKGYNEVWLQGANAWLYRHLHRAAWRMTDLAGKYPTAQGVTRRALNQTARELLLAQASDWPFILSQGTATTYALRRLTGHLGRFLTLYDQLQTGSLDEKELETLEEQDNPFPFLDYTVYR